MLLTYLVLNNNTFGVKKYQHLSRWWHCVKFLWRMQVFLFPNTLLLFDLRLYRLIQHSAQVITDDTKVVFCSRTIAIHFQTSIRSCPMEPTLHKLGTCVISLTQCAEPFPVKHLNQQTIPIKLISCHVGAINFLDTLICDASVGLLLQLLSNTFLFPSLKWFHHLKIVSLLITSGPQTSCNISDTSLLLSLSFIQNSTAHLYLKICKNSLPPIKISSNISNKLTLNVKAMVLAAVPHCISNCTVTHHFFDLDYCRCGCNIASHTAFQTPLLYTVNTPENIFCSCFKESNIIYGAWNIMSGPTKLNLLSPFQSFKKLQCVCHYIRHEPFWCQIIVQAWLSMNIPFTKTQFYEETGSTSMEFQWRKCSISKDMQWRKQYIMNTTFIGMSVLPLHLHLFS